MKSATCQLAKYGIGLAFSAMILSVTSCSSDNEPTTTPCEIQLSRSEAEMVNSQKDFAFKLFAELTAANAAGNEAIAPMSIYTAMSMAANGATGDLKTRLSSELGATSIAGLNDLNRRLTAELKAADSNVELVSANSVWLHPDYSFMPAFTDAVSEYFGAETYSADFSTQPAVDKFNQWCSRATRGLIDRMMESTSDIQLAISNATYFKGIWTSRFSKENTKKAPFYAARGTHNVDMMEKDGGFERLTTIFEGNKKVNVARMTYGNGSFRMTILVPESSEAITDVAPNLTTAKWESIAKAQFAKSDAKIFMPKFNVSGRKSVKNALATVAPTFFSEQLGGLANAPMHISDVNHSVVIEVNEDGTKAAAVTVITGDIAAEPDAEPDFYVNRPFVFVIDEASTGAILFMGLVNNIN